MAKYLANIDITLIFILIQGALGSLKYCNELNLEGFFDAFFNNLTIDEESLIYTENENNPAICIDSDNYNKDVAPAKPMNINVDIDVFEITDVDGHDHTISILMAIKVSWMDDRTVPSFESLIDKELSQVDYSLISLSKSTTEDLWKPNININGMRNIIRNVRKLSTKNEDKLFYDLNFGLFSFRYEMLVTISCHGMDYSNYPYDSHRCPLLLYDELQNGNGSHINITNLWFLYQNHPEDQGIPFYVSIKKHPMAPFQKEGSKSIVYLAGANIYLKRRTSHIISSYFLPLEVYVILSWISFTIPKEIVKISFALWLFIN